MRTLATALLIACLILTGCSDAVTSALEKTADAALKVAKADFPEYAGYLTMADDCLTRATAILSDSGTGVQKTAAIGIACALAATAVLPANAPPALQLLASSLAIFLAAITPHNGAVADQHPRMRLNSAAMARIRAKVARFK